jgi:hypothetical protein
MWLAFASGHTSGGSVNVEACCPALSAQAMISASTTVPINNVDRDILPSGPTGKT